MSCAISHRTLIHLFCFVHIYLDLDKVVNHMITCYVGTKIQSLHILKYILTRKVIQMLVWKCLDTIFFAFRPLLGAGVILLQKNYKARGFSHRLIIFNFLIIKLISRKTCAKSFQYFYLPTTSTALLKQRKDTCDHDVCQSHQKKRKCCKNHLTY